MSEIRSSWRRMAGAVIVSVLLSGLFIAPIGCSRNGPPVEVVLPNGFTGAVYVILDKTRGSDIPFRDGKYIVEIPLDGRLRVNSLVPFDTWHEETWRYASGEILVDEKLVHNPDPQKVMKRMQNAGIDNGVAHIEVFVGTDQQLKDFIRGPRLSLD